MLQAVARKSVEKEEVLDLYVRPQNGVVIKGVHRIMAAPFGRDLDRLELWDTRGKDRPNVVFPQTVIQVKIVIVHRRVDVGMPATLIGTTAVFAHMDAGRINGQRQVAVQRLFRREDPREPLAWLYWHVDPSHLRRARSAWTRCVQHLATGDDLARFQRHALHTVARSVLGDGDDFVFDIFHAPLAGGLAPPVEHGRGVPKPFVHKVD